MSINSGIVSQALLWIVAATLVSFAIEYFPVTTGDTWECTYRHEKFLGPLGGEETDTGIVEWRFSIKAATITVFEKKTRKYYSKETRCPACTPGSPAMKMTVDTSRVVTLDSFALVDSQNIVHGCEDFSGANTYRIEQSSLFFHTFAQNGLLAGVKMTESLIDRQSILTVTRQFDVNGQIPDTSWPRNAYDHFTYLASQSAKGLEYCEIQTTFLETGEMLRLTRLHESAVLPGAQRAALAVHSRYSMISNLGTARDALKSADCMFSITGQRIHANKHGQTPRGIYLVKTK